MGLQKSQLSFGTGGTIPPRKSWKDKKLYDLYERLVHDFSSSILLIPVDLLPARGLLLSIRHKLGKAPTVVIASKQALRPDLPYEVIKQAVKEERNQLAAEVR